MISSRLSIKNAIVSMPTKSAKSESQLWNWGGCEHKSQWEVQIARAELIEALILHKCEASLFLLPIQLASHLNLHILFDDFE